MTTDALIAHIENNHPANYGDQVQQLVEKMPEAVAYAEAMSAVEKHDDHADDNARWGHRLAGVPYNGRTRAQIEASRPTVLQRRIDAAAAALRAAVPETTYYAIRRRVGS